MKQDQFLARVDIRDSLDILIEDVARTYQLGNVAAFDVIPIGFEDCNIHVHTNTGQYLVKVFSKHRTQQSINRYVDVIRHACAADVRHPRLRVMEHGIPIYIVEDTSPLIVLEYIPGLTFSSLGRAPNDDELSELLMQLARLHASEYRPGYVHDTWSVQNIYAAHERVRNHVPSGDVSILSDVLNEFADLDFDQLSHAFVHADCTKSNVLLGDDGRVYVLDFSVAGYFPKIQDLAVIAANLLHKSGTSLYERVVRVGDIYTTYGVLTEYERSALYTYAKGAVAMELLGALQERHLGGNDTPEVAYWYRIGHEGLKALSVA